MEDLWKVRSLDWQLPDMADKAEYQRLVKRFHDEEVEIHMRDLLYSEPQDPPPK